jgi:hypothetical protein
MNIVDQYENHWYSMGMTKKPLPKAKIRVIYTMHILRRAVSCEMLVNYSGQDYFTVKEVLSEWSCFLEKQGNHQPPRYGLPHSYREFLRRPAILEAAEVDLADIAQDIANIMT